MKKYVNPEVEVIEVNTSDVITTSPGTETPWYEESDGIWEFGISLQYLLFKKVKNQKKTAAWKG